MDLPDDILQRSPEEAARRIALGFLDDARQAFERLADPRDAEALHDFRVAIRRLRSTLRAWWPYVKGSISKKDAKGLKALQSATGGGRDAEVLLEWVAPQRATMRGAQRVGLDWMVDHLRARKEEGYAEVLDDVRKRFDALEQRLRRRLARMRVEVRLDRPSKGETWAMALAERAHEHAAELAEHLAQVHGLGDLEEAHQARIAVKRLRYLLEPVRPHSEEARAIVRRCKRLQDVLGDLNDSAVLMGHLGAGLERAAAERARRLHELALEQDQEEQLRRESTQDERAGLLELTRRVNERMRVLLEELEREWLGDHVEEFHRRVDALADELAGGGAGQDVEIERKYLLSGLPPEARSHPVVEIEQGYIPGDRLNERVRRVRHATGVDHKRTVKLGSGVRRFELDEPTTPEIFEGLWPLTEGRRVLKRRYEVPVGDLVWEIDEFTDRELFLAEVELPSEDVEVEIPEWLAPHVVREVTDEDAYVNLRLAK